nr:thioredoxin glutathione reductase [Cryptocaryon irritans]
MQPDFDFDLFVIGGGSGGLSCARKAAELGKKVGLADFVKPSPQGSKWGLGGTCVNVGCIPKKLNHYCAQLGEMKQEQKESGWLIDPQSNHDWKSLVEKIQMYIKKLNFGYRSSLINENVKYFNRIAKFIDAHTIQLKDGEGQVSQTIRAKFVLVAVGGRPMIPEQLQESKQYLLTSDDIFSQKKSPGKTLCIGASYVSLECAGYLTSLGYDVTVMVRSILLRGFDQQMAELIGQYMENHNTKFLRGYVPKKVIKMEDGQLKVQYSKAGDTKQIREELFDSVFIATGRKADTKNIGLEDVGVKIDLNGKVFVNENEQTNIANIYSIGDCAVGRPELTPPAIFAGRILARRLFDNYKKPMDYEKIPTTVFTPIEYGACGISEEESIKRFGKDNIEVYHTFFKPLEWNLNPKNSDYSCYIKIICHIPDQERIVGIHFIGPNAGEVIQGYSVAMKMGATKEDIDSTVGIHPTCSEEIIGLKKTKRTDPNPAKSGC